jgi:cephalosporin-C deacetylase
MDTICPPSTVYAAFNRHTNATRQIEVYTHNGHEGGQAFQFSKQARFLADLV